MKHCPSCNFSFPDFHCVCDFDGTELVLDPERQSLMRVEPYFSYPRPGLKTPMLLTSLAVLGLFLSAVFIGYLESPPPSIPAIVKNQDAQNLPRDLTTSARNPDRLADIKKRAVPSKRTRTLSAQVAVSSTARLRGKSVADSRPRNEVIARTADSRPRNEVIARTADSRPRNQVITRTADSRPRNEVVARTADSRPRNEVIPRTQDSKGTSKEKTPKVVAILKTTWKVLKKPFDF